MPLPENFCETVTFIAWCVTDPSRPSLAIRITLAAIVIVASDNYPPGKPHHECLGHIARGHYFN